MKKIFKKIGLSLAALACVVCAGFGFALGSSDKTQAADAAGIAANDYYFGGTGVRLKNDAHGSGIRFHTHLSLDEYSQIEESGTLMIPEIRFDGSLTVEDLNNEPKYKPAHVVTKGVVDGEEVDLWFDTTVNGDTYKRSTAYLYDIPEQSYGARIIAVSYVRYTGSDEYVYISDSIKQSLSDVATTVYNTDGVAELTKAQVAPYIVSDVTLKYNMPDGSTQTETVAYGALVSGPTYDKDYYVISEATDQYGNAVNFANYNATLPVTIDVQFLTKKTVTKQWIKDGLAATDGGRAWQNGSTATTVTEGIPNGYSSVLRLDWYQQSTSQWKAGSNPFYRGNYDKTDLSGYERVTFGWKLETNGTAVIKFLNGTITEGKTTVANEWIFIDLVQTSANVWSVTVTNVDGEVYYTRDGITRGSNAVGDVDSIASLLFQTESTSIQLLPCASTESTASVYMTEVIGQLDTSDFDNGIPDNATRIWNHIWNAYYFTGGAGAEGEYAPEETAPKGFSYVSKYSWTTGGDFPKTGHFNAADISIYSDLYFAIKADNAQIYVQGADAYTDGGWLYVHIHQNDNGTWTKDYRSEDGYFNNTSQVSGNITGTKLTEMISWKSGVNQGSYPNSAPAGETATGYFTDVLAIKKDGSAITAPAAPSYGMETTFDPTEEIAENAVAALKHPWRSNDYGLSASTEVIPAGFDSAYQYTYASQWFPSHILDGGDTSVPVGNISLYSDLYFALKATGSYTHFYVKGTAHYTGSEWLYVHAQQTADNVWSLHVYSADGAFNGTIAGVSATALNGFASVLYIHKDASIATESTIINMTEVLGVPKSNDVWGDRVIWSAMDGAIPTDEHIVKPTGFTAVYKKTTDTAIADFAAFDLSDTMYQAIAFGFATDKDISFKSGYQYADGVNTVMAQEPKKMNHVLLEKTESGWHVTFTGKYWAQGLGVQFGYVYEADVTGNSLSEIMSTMLSSPKGVTLYVTEVRGTHTCAPTIISLGNGYLQEVCSACGEAMSDPYAFAHGIDPEATEANDSIWRDNNYALSTPDQVAPAGFNNIELYDWLNNSVMVDDGTGTGNKIPYGSAGNDMPLTCLDEAVVDGYSDVYFAMKLVGGAGIYVANAAKYTGGDWMYVHYSYDAESDSWSLSVRTPDGYVQENVQWGITGTTLQQLMNWKDMTSIMGEGKRGGLYPTKTAESTVAKVYFTEILGIVGCKHTVGVNYVSNGDGTHNEVCKNCGFVLVENVTCAGGVATCTTGATCSLCNAKYAEALGHGNITWNWGVGTCNVCGEVAATAATVAPSAVINNGDGRLSDSTNAAGVTAPAGFSSVTNLFSASGNTWANKILTSGHFASANLNPFSEVWFAVKSTGGHFTQTVGGWKDIDTDATSPWVSFHLIREAESTWTIEIYKDGTLWGTQTSQTGSSVGSILDTQNDGGRIVFYQQTANNLSNADVNIYATEVLGVFDTGIASYATNVWDHIWNPYYFVGGGGANGSKWSEEAAPEGFDKVTEYTWQTTNFNGQQGRFNASDITAYSDIWFAMKSPDTTNAPIYIQGANMYAGGGWLYVHYHQNSDGTWNKDFRSADGYFNNDKQVNLTGTKITDMISWTSGVNKGTYPTGSADVATTAYITNVVGVKKCDGTNHTKDIIVNNGDGTHDVTCRCGVVMEDNVACSGGTATCSQAATCSTCGGSYGELAAHTAARTVSNGNDTHSELCACGAVISTTACAGGTATCTEKAVCSTCNTEYGSTLDHTVAEYNTNGDGTHKALCACGAVVVASEPCSGGSGSCTGESTCALCGGTYIANGNHNVAWDGDTGTCTICGETFFDTGISSAATVLWDHIWNTYYFVGGAGANGSKWSEEAAPYGFNKVTEYTWQTTNFNNQQGRFNASDITAYSDIWFAMKSPDTTIYIQGAAFYEGGDWLYIHYHQNSDGTWNKDFRSADGYFNNDKQVNLTGTKITDMISWTSGVNKGTYPTGSADVATTAYLTDVLAVAKCDGTSHTNFTAVSNGDGTHNWYCSCGELAASNVACDGGTVSCTDPAYCAYCRGVQQEAVGHNGTWEGNTYKCAVCGESVATIDETLDKQNVVLFSNATTIAGGAQTPAYITVAEELPLESVSNVTLNGESYAATIENNKIKINVLPKDVFGDYTLTASVVVAGKAFDITAPILVVTNEITTQAGLLSMRNVLRGPDLAEADEFLAIGGKGGDATMNGDGYYMLGADITVAQEKSYVFGTSYVPFVGTFDGNGHILDGYRQNNWFGSTQVAVDSYNGEYETYQAVKANGEVTKVITATTRQDNYLNADQIANGANVDAGVYGTYLEGSFFGVLNGTVKNVAFTNVQQAIFTNIVHSGSGTLQDVYVDISDLQYNTNIYVPIFFARGEIGAGTLHNVVVDVMDAKMSVASPGNRFPSLGKWYNPENVVVYGFDESWISSDGKRGNVYCDTDNVLSDGSEYGIYVEYADETTNGGFFRKIALNDDIWKIVDGRAYLKNVSVSGTVSSPSDAGNVIEPDEGVGYSLVWNDNSAGAYAAAAFISDKTTTAIGGLGANVADLSDFSKKQIIVGNYETYDQYLEVDVVYSSQADYGVYTRGNTIFVLAESEEGFELAAQELCRRLYNWNQFTYEYLDGERAFNIDAVDSIDISEVGNYTSHIAFEYRLEGNTVGNGKGDFGFNAHTNYTNFISMHNALNYFGVHGDTETVSAADAACIPTWTGGDKAFALADNSDEMNKDAGQQLCYLGQGDAATFWAMVDHVATVIENKKAATPNMKVINFMQEDARAHCDCSYCDMFGDNHSVTQLLFINEVKKVLVNRGCNVEIEFFAYNDFSFAPITTAATLDTIVTRLTSGTRKITYSLADVDYTRGTHSYTTPADEKVLVAEPGLWLEWTTHEMNHSFELDHEANAHAYLALLAWLDSVPANNINVFAYQATYNNYFIPLNTWAYQVDYYQKLNALGIHNYIFNLGDVQNELTSQTGFAAFKAFIDSRAMRDVNVSFDTLKDEFFSTSGYYGAAGPKMLQFFEELVEVMEERKQGDSTKTTDFVSVGDYTDYTGTMGNAGGYIATWKLGKYYDESSFPNRYIYERQGFFNGSYAWNVTAMLFGTRKSSKNNLAPDTNLYAHSDYSYDQAATLQAWYTLCMEAKALVAGDAVLVKRVEVESLFPEFAYLTYHSTYTITNYGKPAVDDPSTNWINEANDPGVVSTEPSIDNVPFECAVEDAWYQTFYQKVKRLGVAVPAEQYTFEENKNKSDCVMDGTLSRHAYMYTSMWKNWGIDAANTGL